jgi:alpha-mannosidase II
MDLSYPSVRGDFFSYADKDEEYWTGYFTSRAFWKQYTRVVESLLRGTEILHSLVLNSPYGDPQSQEMKEIFLKIVNSRRAVSVFQHHVRHH